MSSYNCREDAEKVIGKLVACYELDFYNHTVIVWLPVDCFTKNRPVFLSDIVLDLSNNYQLITEDQRGEIKDWLLIGNTKPSRITAPICDAALAGVFWAYIINGYQNKSHGDSNWSYTQGILKDDQPKNNDNRETCFKCSGPVKKVPGFNYGVYYHTCTKCGA